MPVVELPDKTTISFPDDMDAKQIETAVKNIWDGKSEQDKTPTDYWRVASEGLGGLIGGLVGAGSPVPGGAYIGTGLGAGIGGQAYDIGKSFVKPEQKQPTLPQRLLRGAEDVALNMAIPAGMELAGRGLYAVEKSTLPAIKNMLVGKEPMDVLRAFQSVGVSPSAGSVSGSRGIQGLEKAAGYMFGGSRIMQEQAQKQLAQTGSFVNDLSGYGVNLGQPEQAGKSIRGYASGALERFKTTSKDKFDFMKSFFSDDEPVYIKNTVDYLQKEVSSFTPALAERFAKGPSAILGDVLKDSASLASSGVPALPSKTVRALRTYVGDYLTDGVNAVGDTSYGQMKQLYKGLSNDLEIASMAKGPDAMNAFKEANSFYKANMAKGGPVEILDNILKKGIDKDVFDLVIAKNGSYLDTMKKQFTQEEWDNISATVLGRMGKAAPSRPDITDVPFSPGVFLRNWDHLTKEAKDALFKGTSYENLSPKMDQLLTVVKALKSTEAMANPSGTAPTLGFQALISGLGAAFIDPMAGVSAFVIPTVSSNGIARLMTNPDFVNWLVSGIRLYKSNPNTITKHIARLGVVANNEPKIKNDVESLQNFLGGK